MDGYLGVPQERVALDFGGGFSMHVAAWPLLGAWPGERFQTDSIIDYLKFARDTDDRFPGFESDIHGLRFEIDAQTGHKHWLVDCVKE